MELRLLTLPGRFLLGLRESEREPFSAVTNRVEALPNLIYLPPFGLREAWSKSGTLGMLPSRLGIIPNFFLA